MDTATSPQSAVWAVVDNDDDVLDLTADEVQDRVERRLQRHRRHGSHHRVPVIIVDDGGEDEDEQDAEDEAEHHEGQSEV